eukprot:jgi/Picsp_1/6148/NSC_03502-R1_binding protein
MKYAFCVASWNDRILNMKGGYTGASGRVCLSNVRVQRTKLSKGAKGHVSHRVLWDKEQVGETQGCLVFMYGRKSSKYVCRCDSREGQAQGTSDEDAARKAAMLERIQKAKAYKDKLSSSGNAGSQDEKQETEINTPYIFDAFAKYAEDSAKMESEEFLKAQKAVSASVNNAPAKEQSNESIEVEKEENSSSTNDKKSGDPSEAASWLQSVSSQQGVAGRVDPSLNAEQFTLEKEKLIRSQKVTIERAKGSVAGTNRTMPIDDYGIGQQFDEAEQAMAAEREAARQREADLEESFEEGDNLHKPKVATWGVFPRPQNISQAYGGGRNIRPGQELESKEDAKARGDRVSKALAEYRKNAGLEVDSDIEEKATKLYEEGEELFESGNLSSALEKFSASADLVPFKCKIGGLANFRKAVCLDSLGRNEEAYPIYKSLKGHAAPGVSKNSQRMLFGFRAAKKLKVDTMDYSSGGVEAWRGYFDKATEGTWAAYRASQSDSEEDQAIEKSATVVATAVMLLPLLLVSVLAFQH